MLFSTIGDTFSVGLGLGLSTRLMRSRLRCLCCVYLRNQRGGAGESEDVDGDSEVCGDGFGRLMGLFLCLCFFLVGVWMFLGYVGIWVRSDSTAAAASWAER